MTRKFQASEIPFTILFDLPVHQREKEWDNTEEKKKNAHIVFYSVRIDANKD